MRLQFTTGGKIPQFHRIIVTPRCNRSPVGTEGDSQNSVPVPQTIVPQHGDQFGGGVLSITFAGIGQDHRVDLLATERVGRVRQCLRLG